MLRLERCYPEHVAELMHRHPVRASKDELSMFLTPEGADVLATSVAISGWSGGRCVGVCGVSGVGEGRAVAWAGFSVAARPYMRQITRHVKFVLDTQPFRRIEAAVVAEFIAGQKWALMLGFEREGYMRAYTVDGKDAVLYAKVQR